MRGGMRFYPIIGEVGARGRTRRDGETLLSSLIAPPQAAEGAQFCKLPPETRACRKAVARGVQGKYSLDTFSRLGEGSYSRAFLCCLVDLANYRAHPSLISTPNHAPVARRCNRRGLAKPDQGGKQEANGGKLAFIRAVQAFTCHGGGQGHFQFKTSSFSVHNTGSLLLSSLKKVTSPLVPSFSPSLPRKKSPAPGWVQGKKG